MEQKDRPHTNDIRTVDLAPVEWRRPADQFEIKLGQTVRDRLTGLEGVAGARIEYLTGCTQYAVVQNGLKADGDTKDWRYFDWQRLEYAANIANEWAEASAATQRGDGAGEPPQGKY